MGKASQRIGAQTITRVQLKRSSFIHCASVYHPPLEHPFSCYASAIDTRLYYCYLLRCADGSFYTGITTDLERRVAEHNSGRGAHYTASRHPVRLVWKERQLNRSLAQHREAQIKSWARIEKEALVSGRRRRHSRPIFVRDKAQIGEEGVFRLTREVLVKNVAIGDELTGPYWQCGVVDVTRGTMAYQRGDRIVAPTGSTHGIFLPPFSIIRAILSRCRGQWNGLTSKKRLPKGAPRRPVIFPPPSSVAPSTISEMMSVLEGAKESLDVGRAASPSKAALEIKKALDRAYDRPERLSDIAGALRMSPARFARTFKQAFDMPPVEYRRELKRVDEMWRAFSSSI